MHQCSHHEYWDLYAGFVNLKDELIAQEHALKVTGVSDMLDAAKALNERLRQDQNIIKEVTKELS